MSAEERMAYHLAEFKKAVEEIEPSVNMWEGGALHISASRSLLLTLHTRRYSAWELAAIKGASKDELNRLRAGADVDLL